MRKLDEKGNCEGCRHLSLLGKNSEGGSGFYCNLDECKRAWDLKPRKLKQVEEKCKSCPSLKFMGLGTALGYYCTQENCIQLDESPKQRTIKKEDLFKLWAYDAELKMWASGKDQVPEKNLEAIEAILKKTESKRTELYEFITTIEDPYCRVLLNYRCIERRSWKDIAKRLGGSAESHRKALARFIDEI